MRVTENTLQGLVHALNQRLPEESHLRVYRENERYSLDQESGGGARRHMRGRAIEVYCYLRGLAEGIELAAIDLWSKKGEAT